MVMKIPAMVDMALDAKEKAEMAAPPAPNYPYGLCISLCQDELDKLNINKEDLNIGDILHLHCLAKVTSMSCSDNEGGSTCRVELQITNIAAESEDEENEQFQSPEKRIKKLYV
jgi:hypothetical protein